MQTGYKSMPLRHRHLYPQPRPRLQHFRVPPRPPHLDARPLDRIRRRRERGECGGRLLWTLASIILSDSKIAKAFERATGGTDSRPLLVRLLEFARTINTRWNPHSKYRVAYAKPCTNIGVDWEAVRVAIRGHRLQHDEAVVAFEPVSNASGTDAPWCLMFKNDDHVHYGCFFTKDDPDAWWGPKEQLSKITERILGKTWKKAAPRRRDPFAFV
ncbi:hypothetical protein B0H14DRAFT_3160614 [Mycena olivaceomarginata]|nr:hypothetical protein B0H14DRAFT_3160614 [Mycena olivaceomarginata]